MSTQNQSPPVGVLEKLEPSAAWNPTEFVVNLDRVLNTGREPSDVETLPFNSVISAV